MNYLSPSDYNFHFFDKCNDPEFLYSGITFKLILSICLCEYLCKIRITKEPYGDFL